MITATVPKTKTVTSQTGISRYLTAWLAALAWARARDDSSPAGPGCILLAGQTVLAACWPRRCQHAAGSFRCPPVEP
jgi:hypothetical protein